MMDVEVVFTSDAVLEELRSREDPEWVVIFKSIITAHLYDDERFHSEWIDLGGEG